MWYLVISDGGLVLEVRLFSSKQGAVDFGAATASSVTGFNADFVRVRLDAYATVSVGRHPMRFSIGEVRKVPDA